MAQDGDEERDVAREQLDAALEHFRGTDVAEGPQGRRGWPLVRCTLGVWSGWWWMILWLAFVIAGVLHGCGVLDLWGAP